MDDDDKNDIEWPEEREIEIPDSINFDDDEPDEPEDDFDEFGDDDF